MTVFLVPSVGFLQGWTKWLPLCPPLAWSDTKIPAAERPVTGIGVLELRLFVETAIHLLKIKAAVPWRELLTEWGVTHCSYQIRFTLLFSWTAVRETLWQQRIMYHLREIWYPPREWTSIIIYNNRPQIPISVSLFSYQIRFTLLQGSQFHIAGKSIPPPLAAATAPEEIRPVPSVYFYYCSAIAETSCSSHRQHRPVRICMHFS